MNQNHDISTKEKKKKKQGKRKKPHKNIWNYAKYKNIILNVLLLLQN